MAILAAEAYSAIEIDRQNQLSFAIFQGQRSHEDEPVLKAQEFIEQNLRERITVDQLADMSLALGRRSLERRFKKATWQHRAGISSTRKNRSRQKGVWKAAAKHQRNYSTKWGIRTNKVFRTIFRKVTGLSPIRIP